MAASASRSQDARNDLHLDCIHCGICLSACPTYLQLGLEAESPRGRILLIHAVQEHRVEVSSRTFQKHMQLCLECRACESACPSGVRFSAMMDEARSEIYRSQPPAPGVRFLRWLVLGKIFPSRFLMHLTFRILRLYQRSGARRLVRSSGIMRRFPARLAQMEKLLPDVPRSWRFRPAGVRDTSGNPRKVSLFEGCIMPELFGPVHDATLRVLAHHGVAASLPARQACCGALHLHMGDLETARSLARRNIDAFEKDGAETIVVNAAGCGAMLKEYGHLLSEDAAYAGRARGFSRRVSDISEYLDAMGIDRNLAPLDWKITYDDPCHLLHAQKVRAAPRNLIRAIPGIQFVELRDADRCCGSAGVYNITQPEMAARILDEKVANIIRSGAQVVVTGNPGCSIQIQSGLREKNQTTRVMHPIELLDQAYRPGDSHGSKP
jgi:glycolate oxidase iron-sulfur subunit